MTTEPGNLPSSGEPTAPPILPARAARSWLSSCLSVFIILFLANAFISLADDSLILFNGLHALGVLRTVSDVAEVLGSIGVYILMALAPSVPKRIFVPLTLFAPVTCLLSLPFVVCDYQHAARISWIISVLQVIVGLAALLWLKQGRRSIWPLVPAEKLAGPGFNWRNLILFTLANLFGFIPAIFIYLFICASAGINHFTDGFMSLAPTGFSVQSRVYTRDDGKVIQLFPMSHIADAAFYHQIEQTFPTNSLILMEGVTDEQNLLKNKISYRRMAKSLGLAEQHEAFAPRRGQTVRADVDVDQFSSNTIAVLNLVMQFHSQGMNPTNTQALLQFAPSPDFENQLFGDLLLKRNQHLLGVIQDKLPQTQYIVVPWGVAHMPGISAGIQKLGFHLKSAQKFSLIRFFHFRHPSM